MRVLGGRRERDERECGHGEDGDGGLPHVGDLLPQSIA